LVPAYRVRGNLIHDKPLIGSINYALGDWIGRRERLAMDGGAVELVGHRRDVASLFTDVAGFTTLVETIEPDVLGSLLNAYLASGAREFTVFQPDAPAVGRG
jgi:class 3 adenylate cyclase